MRNELSVTPVFQGEEKREKEKKRFTKRNYFWLLFPKSKIVVQILAKIFLLVKVKIPKTDKACCNPSSIKGSIL
jgi:hypothetical protein